jgi:uncharacterized Zn finger protein
MHNYTLLEAIPDRILERGFDYYENGNVLELEEIGQGEYTAVVEGMELYTVYIKIVEECIVSEHYCTCPYDWGLYCKHFVAVLEAIEAGEYTSATDNANHYYAFQQLKNNIEGLSKEELQQLILDVAKRDKPLRRMLIDWLEEGL